MSFKQILEDRLKVLDQPYNIAGDEIKTTCLNPDHIDNKPSYFINVKTGVSHCFSCGFSPHPAKLIGASEEDTEELLRNAQYNYYKEQLVSDEDYVPQEFFLPPKAYSIDKDWRGVSKELLQKLGVYYCSTGRYSGRLVFPIVKDGVVQGFDARIVNPNIVPDKLKDTKWIRPAGTDAQGIVYGYEYLKASGLDCSHVVLTEGVADAISYLELGIAAIPNFGVAPPNSRRITQLLELGCRTITLGFDNDTAGQTAIMKVYPFYKEWFDIKAHWATSRLNKSEFKDMNEALQGGLFKDTEKLKGLK